MFYTSLPELRRIEHENMSLRKGAFRYVAKGLYNFMTCGVVHRNRCAAKNTRGMPKEQLEDSHEMKK